MEESKRKKKGKRGVFAYRDHSQNVACPVCARFLLYAHVILLHGFDTLLKNLVAGMAAAEYQLILRREP